MLGESMLMAGGAGTALGAGLGVVLPNVIGVSVIGPAAGGIFAGA